MKLHSVIALSTAALITSVHAQTERDLDSHEHGAANLNVAIEGSSIYIEMESPWNNLVGFEHAPSTDEQHKLVDDAMALLQDPLAMFTFAEASCSLASLNIESSLGKDEEHNEHADDEHHDEEEHDHEEHHDDEDEHDHDEHAHDEDTHSSVLATYELQCETLDSLSSIDVEFFQTWSGFEELDVQLIGPSGQSAMELTPQATRMDVSNVL